MKMLWKVINAMEFGKLKKTFVFLGILFLINAALGGVLWLALGRMVLPEMEWLLCFIGYPAMFVGVFGGTLYLYNHEYS